MYRVIKIVLSIYLFFISIYITNATIEPWMVKCLEQKWHTKWEITLLLSIKEMECNRGDGKCLSRTNDYWYFQINKRWHLKEVNQSLNLWEDKYALFEYQSSVAYKLIQSYKCWTDLICIWWAYNWSKSYWYRLQNKFTVVQRLLW